LAVTPRWLPPALKFHALRHTYASLCVAAGIPPLQLSRFMGHAKVTTTLGVYAHLFADDHSDAMTVLAALSRPASPNVVPMRRRG
jgi:integrase